MKERFDVYLLSLIVLTIEFAKRFISSIAEG